MTEQGHIYMAPKNDIPPEDVVRLNNYLDDITEKLKGIKDAKTTISAKAISELVKQHREKMTLDALDDSIRVERQMKFDFAEKC